MTTFEIRCALIAAGVGVAVLLALAAFMMALVAVLYQPCSPPQRFSQSFTITGPNIRLL